MTTDGVVAGVSTIARDISAGCVVLATGSWTANLLKPLGVDLPILGRAITVAEVELSFDAPRLMSFMDPISDSWLSPVDLRTGYISVRNQFTGSVVDPAVLDPYVDNDATREGIERVSRRFPALADCSAKEMWTSHDSYVPDGKPVIGAVAGLSGLYLNTASAGKGHKVAPAVGEALARVISGADLKTVDLTPFHPSRLAGLGFPSSGTEYKQRTIG
jgi:sarcosine oxidase subunit beta